MKKSRIQKQWDDAADSWADFVRAGKDWTREYLNNPAMFKMLGNIRGRKVLDLGCGEGHNSRIMARRGARVTGIDFSRKMIELAVEEEKRAKHGIEYYRADAVRLRRFKGGSYDIVTSFLALQDIENFQAAINEAARVLKKRGRFVFAITHPCFEARIIGGRKTGGWVYGGEIMQWASEIERDTAKNDAPSYYSVDMYFDDQRDTVDWRMDRLKKPFTTTSFHRTLTDYAAALHDANLLISRLDEPRPTKKGMRSHPVYFRGNLRIPHSIVIEAVKY